LRPKTPNTFSRTPVSEPIYHSHQRNYKVFYVLGYVRICHTPYPRIHPTKSKNMQTIIIEQMELSVGKQPLCLVDARLARRRRASGWFSKMRQTVRLALPAKRAPIAPPEQNHLPIHERITSA
jgi:hypothetical protein